MSVSVVAGPRNQPQVKVLLEVARPNRLERGAENTRRPRDWRMVAPNEVKQGREFESSRLRSDDGLAEVQSPASREYP